MRGEANGSGFLGHNHWEQIHHNQRGLHADHLPLDVRARRKLHSRTMTTEELYAADLGETPGPKDTFAIPKASAPDLETGTIFQVVGEEEGAWIIRPSSPDKSDVAEPSEEEALPPEY